MSKKPQKPSLLDLLDEEEKSRIKATHRERQLSAGSSQLQGGISSKSKSASTAQSRSQLLRELDKQANVIQDIAEETPEQWLVRHGLKKPNVKKEKTAAARAAVTFQARQFEPLTRQDLFEHRAGSIDALLTEAERAMVTQRKGDADMSKGRQHDRFSK